MASKLMPLVATRWPQLRVELVESVTHTLLTGVLNRELSLALLYDPPGDAGLIAQPLLMERLHLVGSPAAARPLGKLKRVRVQDVAPLPLVLAVRGQIIRVLVDDAFAEAGLPLVPRYEANSPALLKALAAQGLGFTVLTLGSVADDLSAGRLVALPFADRGMSLMLTLVTTREHGRLRVVQMMGALIAAEVRRMAAAGSWPGSPQVMKG